MRELPSKLDSWLPLKEVLDVLCQLVLVLELLQSHTTELHSPSGYDNLEKEERVRADFFI